MVGRRGDRQLAAERLDTVDRAMILDEGHHRFDRRSSPAAAKYALAFRRISLAWRSSRFSRSSVFSRERSSLLSPPLATIPLAPPHPLPKRLGRAADLRRHRAHRRPFRSVLLGLPSNHPHRALTQIGRIGLHCSPCLHGSILPDVGASGKTGAVQSPTPISVCQARRSSVWQRGCRGPGARTTAQSALRTKRRAVSIRRLPPPP